eukprot:GHVO01033414.1.p1 GENE.GHVO01033414.1~~GHVO01033414.1.p1  ORF type:complete len:234 (-),score=16.13 GHVO01033414.1:129-758(-)
MVNISLAELTLSRFFRFYYGALLAMAGYISIWRMWSHKEEEDEDSNVKSLQRLRNLMKLLAFVTIATGLSCFLIPRHYIVQSNRVFKVIYYMFAGTAMSFSTLFGIVDIFNYVAGLFQAEYSRSIIQSRLQILVVLIYTLAVGMNFGFLFGLSDVDKASNTFELNIAFMKDQNSCFPVAMVTGTATGLACEVIRQRDKSRLDSPFDVDV